MRNFNRIEWTLLVTAWFAVGCTIVDQHRAPPADWPELKRIIHKVGYWELQKICGRDGILFGCGGYAIVDLAARTCTIYYTGDGEWGQRALEHEEDHCQGKDHIGMKTLANLWEKYKRNMSMGDVK